MDTREIEREIQVLRNGMLPLERIRKLPTEIGRACWKEGIPILIELADSADAIVRYNVVMSLSYKFEYRSGRSLLCRLLEGDPDVDCREAAAGGLAFLFKGSHDCNLISLLSRVAMTDPDEEVRNSAFTALLRVSGHSDEDRILLERPEVDEALIREIISECS